VDGPTSDTVEPVADEAEEIVDIIVVATPAGAVGRRAVVAVSVTAFSLASA